MHLSSLAPYSLEFLKMSIHWCIPVCQKFTWLVLFLIPLVSLHIRKVWLIFLLWTWYIQQSATTKKFNILFNAGQTLRQLMHRVSPFPPRVARHQIFSVYGFDKWRFPHSISGFSNGVSCCRNWQLKEMPCRIMDYWKHNVWFRTLNVLYY